MLLDLLHAAGQPIPGSPWTCHVAAADVHPASCRMYGPGLTSIQLGCDSQIFVELADEFGNPVAATDVHALGIKVGPSLNATTKLQTKSNPGDITYTPIRVQSSGSAVLAEYVP